MLTHIVNYNSATYKIQKSDTTRTIVWMNSSRVNRFLCFHRLRSNFDFIPAFRSLTEKNQQSSVNILLSGLLL